MTAINPAIVAELAPTGVLRAAINLANFLLVSGKGENGDPQGVSPDIAAEIARRLGVGIKYMPYSDPGALTNAVGEWDIGNIGAEPQRAKHIRFSPAYCEIEASFLVPAGSAILTLDDVDKPGVRISTKRLAAYGFWLENNIKHAELVKNEDAEASFAAFVEQGLDVLSGLKPRLMSDALRLPGSRILDSQFRAVQQAIGTSRKNTAGAIWIADFVEEAKESGFVASLVEKHGIRGLSVAPPAYSQPTC